MGKMISEEAVQVTFSDEQLAGIDAVAEKTGMSREAVIQDAVRRYLAVRRFHEIRADIVPQARAQGFFTDEDVFRAIS